MIDSINTNRVHELIKRNQAAAKRRIREKLAEGAKKLRPVGPTGKRTIAVA